MLTGKRLFRGETITDILVAVVSQEPDWGSVPAPARRPLKSCLQKDPRHRLRDIADVKLLREEEWEGAVFRGARRGRRVGRRRPGRHVSSQRTQGAV